MKKNNYEEVDLSRVLRRTEGLEKVQRYSEGEYIPRMYVA